MSRRGSREAQEFCFRHARGRGWFPYLRAYGAHAQFFDGTYKYPTVNRVDSFNDPIG